MTAYARLTPETRRAQLIEVGRRLFLERPYDDLGMDEVAAESGVSKGLLYHYFPTKREFYMAVLNAAVDEMVELVRPRPGLAPEQQLRLSLAGYIAYVDEHATAYRAVLKGGIGSDPDVVAIADRFRDTAFALILSAAPGPVDDQLAMAVRGWIGFVEAVSLDWLRTRRPPREQLVELLIQTLTEALASWGSA